MAAAAEEIPICTIAKGLLKNVCDLVGALKQKEVVLKFNKHGLEIIAMDDSLVSMVDIRLTKADFVDYFVTASLEIPIELEKINAAIKLATPMELSLSYRDNNLLVQFGTNEFQFPFLDARDRKLPTKLPQLSPGSKIVITSDLLQQAVRNAAFVSDVCVLYSADEHFVLEAEEDRSKAVSRISPDELVKADMNGKEDSRAMYDISLLERAVKCSRGDVSLKWDKDHPFGDGVSGG